MIPENVGLLRVRANATRRKYGELLHILDQYATHLEAMTAAGIADSEDNTAAFMALIAEQAVPVNVAHNAAKEVFQAELPIEEKAVAP